MTRTRQPNTNTTATSSSAATTHPPMTMTRSSSSSSGDRSKPPSTRNTSQKTNNARTKNTTKVARKQTAFPPVAKAIVDELLLVCGVLGSVDTTTGSIIPTEDCLNWLQDLQLVLRRDEDRFRPVSLLLGQWNIVQHQLIPLVQRCRYDTDMVLTICKILVMLTKPLTPITLRYARMAVPTVTTTKATTTTTTTTGATTTITPHTVTPLSEVQAGAVVREQQWHCHENAMQQLSLLVRYKRLFAQHPIVVATWTSLLAEPLQTTTTTTTTSSSRGRTEAQQLKMELILHLIRNLWAIDAPSTSTTTTTATTTATVAGGSPQTLHHQWILLAEKELLLEILIVLGADIELRENASYNLLLMELLFHLVRHEDPYLVAKATRHRRHRQGDAATTTQAERSDGVRVKTAATTTTPGLLRQTIQKEKYRQVSGATVRHSQFGGTLERKERNPQTGREHTRLSTTAALDPTVAATLPATALLQHNRRGRKKKDDPFLPSTGAMTSSSVYSSTPLVSTLMLLDSTAEAAYAALDRFGQRFLDRCYGPVMKSLKNEFRRDSVRLEEGDRVVFFRLITFWIQWWRATGATTVHNLVFTMDIFTWKLILSSIESFSQHKKYQPLAYAVSLLTQQMHLLWMLYNHPSHDGTTGAEPTSSTEQLMALGLLDRLFYGDEPLDVLPKLMQKWTPGTTTREYVCDLVELCHITLKLLEAHSHRTARAMQELNRTTGTKSLTKKTKKKDEAPPLDTIAKFHAAAAEFDVTQYLVRKLISNHTIYLYTQLLSQYSMNSATINHRIVTFFRRVMRVVIYEPDDETISSKHGLANQRATLEPLLYNIRLLTVCDAILHDTSLCWKDSSSRLLIEFSIDLITRFASAAKRNPCWFVEVLIPHPAPGRFCGAVTNYYVSEELRMLADRELLLRELQQPTENDENDHRYGNDREDVAEHDNNDDDDEELVFDGDETSTKFSKKSLPVATHTNDNCDVTDKDPEQTMIHQESSRYVPQPKSLEESDDEELVFDDLLPRPPDRRGALSSTAKHVLEDSDDEEWEKQAPRKKRIMNEDDEQ